MEQAKMEVAKEAKAAKVEVKKKQNPATIAATFLRLAIKGAKSREDLAEKIMADFKARNISKNKNNKPITIEAVTRQIGNMLRDVASERGKSSHSWWSQYNIVEDDNTLKLVLKA